MSRVTDPSALPHVADLIDYGEITVGVIDPVGCVAPPPTAPTAWPCSFAATERPSASSSSDSTSPSHEPSSTTSSQMRSTGLPERSKPPLLPTDCVHFNDVDTITLHERVKTASVPRLPFSRSL